MKTLDFLNKHRACLYGREWALSISDDMADVWDAMIEQKKYEWLFWTVGREGVFSDRVLRLLICRLVRETPLHDGRKVWDLLTDELSRNLVVVAERSSNGEANQNELTAARDADAVWTAAKAATSAAARDAARDAVDGWDAAWAAARNAARDAQILMVKDLGNPFKGDSK
jgi:hypothetical protein